MKQQIANVIRSVARDYHFLSLKEYKALLTLYNVGLEEVRSPQNPPQADFKGLGLIYFALNEKGEKISLPFKSSLFGKGVGIKNIEKRIEKSAEIIKNKKLKERGKQVISVAMQQCKNRSGFERALDRQGISVLFRTNDEGRIYGATFIDHEQKCVFNGSRLGKEFSANVFNDLFNGKNLNHDLPDFKINRIDTEKSSQSFNQENQGSDIIGGIFDLFGSETSASDEMAEQDLVHRLKKKKRRYGRQM